MGASTAIDNLDMALQRECRKQGGTREFLLSSAKFACFAWFPLRLRRKHASVGLLRENHNSLENRQNIGEFGKRH
jgi:hypothetical protein